MNTTSRDSPFQTTFNSPNFSSLSEPNKCSIDWGSIFPNQVCRGWGEWEEGATPLWLLSCPAHLPEHLQEVIDVGGAERLGLEALGLEQVLGDVRRVNQHPMQRALLVPVGLEHDLIKDAKESVRAPSPTSFIRSKLSQNSATQPQTRASGSPRLRPPHRGSRLYTSLRWSHSAESSVG